MRMRGSGCCAANEAGRASSNGTNQRLLTAPFAQESLDKLFRRREVVVVELPGNLDRRHGLPRLRELEQPFLLPGAALLVEPGEVQHVLAGGVDHGVPG